jgi:hypothetical protein
VEIAFFDRGPLDGRDLIVGGYWSAYWYNGAIYASEISRGLDAFKLKAGDLLSQNEIDAAGLAQVNAFNAQSQSRVTWPAVPAIARAYVDQLIRSNAISRERGAAISDAAGRAARLRRRDKGAAAAAGELDVISNGLASEAGNAGTIDAARMRSLAATIRGMSAKLR